MSKVLIAEGLGYNLLSVSQLMTKGIHLEADSTTQEFKLYHGRGGLYIGKAVLKNNVFVLDFVPDLGTADSDAIVNFTDWTHPPDLDPDFSPGGFWYSHTIPEAERTRALATIQQTPKGETTSAATTSAAATSAATTTVVATTSATPTTAATTPVTVDETPPTPAQQLNPTQREVHQSANLVASFYSNSDYRPPEARAGRFSQRAQWGLHLGIEKNYNAWRIFDVHTKETVAARDVIFYERLTLQTYLANLHENRDPTGGFRGDRAFASAADEADWDEQNVDNASEEAGPLPYCSVDVPMDEENPRESNNADVFYHFADTGYVTPATVNTNEAERVGPNFIPNPEVGDEAAYPEDPELPRYSQTGLQILGLVTAVHGATIPKEPATVQQALEGEHREKWREAMDKELKALEERNTWKIVPIGVAQNKTILTGKWVFRVKTKADGTIDKFKARWVVRGFDQEHGRDYTETFAPVSRHTSLRILIAVAAMKKKKLRQIDVANAFLYAPVDAEIFVELPHGSHDEPNRVCQLLKSLYGIKQAPRLWQQYLHARLIRIGFKQLPHDQGMYRLTKGSDYVLLIVYVDDLLYIGSTDGIATYFEGELQKDLTITVSPTVTQYLGLNIREEENAIYLSAEKYADTIAKRFSLTPTAIATPYRYTSGTEKGRPTLLKPAGIRDYQKKLGCLLFAAVTCRPDLSYSASQLATYLKKP
ncbi:unnamed protein product [Closterium sp. NIES-53]